VEALEKAMDDLGRPKSAMRVAQERAFPRVSTLLDEEGVKARARAAQMLSEVVPCPHVWRPIETAPLDGRRILVWDPEFGGGWTYASSDNLMGSTHWMTIPEPPK
jgi:hypothetical protein